MVIGGLLWFAYNKLQSLYEGVKEAAGGIAAAMEGKVQLARQLIEIAKEYGAHEQFVHSYVAQVESSPSGGQQTTAPVGNVAGVFSQVARAYPELRASESHQQLMSQLEEAEREVMSRRDRHNSAVRQYNTRCSTLPAVLFPSKLGFESVKYFSGGEGPLEVFETDTGERLRGSLAYFGQAVSENSKRIGASAGETAKRLRADERVRELAEYSRSRFRKKDS